MSSMEHASFNPAHTTPCSTATIIHHSSPQTPTRPVRCHLSFTSDNSEDDQDPDSTLVHSDEEDFQTVPLGDEHWMAEIVPERTFCIHKMAYPTTYANTQALMETVTLSLIWTA